jgi:hypothetical protein
MVHIMRQVHMLMTIQVNINAKGNKMFIDQRSIADMYIGLCTDFHSLFLGSLVNGDVLRHFVWTW